MSEEELKRQQIADFVKKGLANYNLTKEDLLFIIAKKNQKFEELEEEIMKLNELFGKLLRSDLDLVLDQIRSAKQVGNIEASID